MFGKTKDPIDHDGAAEGDLTVDDFFGDEAAVAETVRVDHLQQRVTQVEQQINSQFTSLAAYAQIAQEQVEMVRSEALHANERSEQKVIALIERERTDRLTDATGVVDVTARLDALDAQIEEIRQGLQLCLSNQKALADAITDLFQPAVDPPSPPTPVSAPPAPTPEPAPVASDPVTAGCHPGGADRRRIRVCVRGRPTARHRRRRTDARRIPPAAQRCGHHRADGRRRLRSGRRADRRSLARLRQHRHPTPSRRQRGSLSTANRRTTPGNTLIRPAPILFFAPGTTTARFAATPRNPAVATSSALCHTKSGRFVVS